MLLLCPHCSRPLRLLTQRPGFGAAECDGGHRVAVIVSRSGGELAAKLHTREKKADIKRRIGIRSYDADTAFLKSKGIAPQALYDEAVNMVRRGELIHVTWYKGGDK